MPRQRLGVGNAEALRLGRVVRRDTPELKAIEDARVEAQVIRVGQRAAVRRWGRRHGHVDGRYGRRIPVLDTLVGDGLVAQEVCNSRENRDEADRADAVYGGEGQAAPPLL